MKRLALILILLAAPVAAGEYHGNRESHIFHDSGCRYYHCKNCTRIFATRDDALAAGYRPCKICRP